MNHSLIPIKRDMIARFFDSQTRSVPSAALILAASAFLSAFLGLLRDRLLADRFGAGPELDAYFAAFRIPDFLYAIFIMGGISAVFLPVFSEYMEKGKDKAFLFASALLNVLSIILIVCSVVLFLVAPLLIALVAPGFSMETKSLAASLTRCMLLSPIFFGLSSVFSGMLHYFRRFIIYALAPVLYNAGIILGILFLTPSMGIWGVAIGVAGGALLYLLSQIPNSIALGFSWHMGFKHEGVARVFTLALPRTVAGAAYHLNLVFVTALASMLPAGSLAIFTFANNIQYLPAGILGVSFALASFPQLSTLYAQRDDAGFQDVLLKTIKRTCLLILPLAFLLFLFREQIVHIIFRTGKFGGSDESLVASSLAVFACGILFQSLSPLLSRAFFALQDTKTPTLISIFSMICNVALALLLIRYTSLGVVSLALSLSIATVIQCILLLIFLRRRIFK